MEKIIPDPGSEDGDGYGVKKGLDVGSRVRNTIKYRSF
jgi:hypothetical protein